MSEIDKTPITVVLPKDSEHNAFRFFTRGSTQRDLKKSKEVNIDLEKWNQFLDPEYKVESS